MKKLAKNAELDIVSFMTAFCSLYLESVGGTRSGWRMTVQYPSRLAVSKPPSSAIVLR